MRRTLAVLILCAVASSATAQPSHKRWGYGYGPGHSPRTHWGAPRPHYDPGTAFWGGLVGGAIAGWLTREQSERPGREETEADLEPWSKEWFGWCVKRYRSFNPETGTYRGYDGADHFCGG